MPLSSFMRYEQSATGTKVVCEEGDCGACSVLLGRLGSEGEISYRAVNSCIQFMYQLDRTHIITIEGLKSGNELNAVQNAMVECHGAQCGYCTPGFVVTMCSMFDRKPPINAQDVKDALTGNLCRCTGYEPIIKAALEVNPKEMLKIGDMYPHTQMKADFEKSASDTVSISDGEHALYVPRDLADALRIKSEYPQATPVAGGTDVCVYWNKRGIEPKILLSLGHLDELRKLEATPHAMTVGATVTLAQLEEFIQSKIPALANIMWLFGSPQIRNAGTLAGNIANGSPIADTIPFLFVMNAAVEVANQKGSRRININEFYKGYKQLALAPDEIITAIHVPVPQSDESLRLYKVSKRKHLDISAVTAAFRLKLRGEEIQEVSIAYGGIAATVVRMPKTEAYLRGKKLELETFRAAGRIAREEINPISDVRGSRDFRLNLAENILQKLYFELKDPRSALCPQ